ncbi:hypothetical protein V3851_10290 [Paenibacillus sp. M1]|uniref:Uncharacterized protein n=1 Tax=Paenibacillus haidiansis TaxID=1574488 RepID=A0ABU7VR29_9BACL
MYVSRVVTGRIIEYKRDSVVTLQGDTVSTYNLRYYTLREIDVEPRPAYDRAEDPAIGGVWARLKRRRLRDREAAALPWPLFWKKGANRI